MRLRTTPGRLAATGLLGLLAGCASAPAISPPVDAPVTAADAGPVLPARWAAAPAEAQPPRPDPAGRWWTAWGDATLDALVEQALRAQPDVDAAAASLRQARALRSQAEAAAAVQLDLSASAQAGRSRPSGGPTSRSRSVGLGLDASWEADLFGRLDASTRAAAAEVEAARWSLADTRASVAAETVLAYLELRTLQTRRALARDNLASQRETAQIAAWRRQAGLISELELDQARSAAAQTAAVLTTLETSLAQRAHALAVLTGQAPAALAGLRDQTVAAPATPVDPSARIPAETLRQRPDVRRAEAAWQAEVARLDAAQAARRPRLVLSGEIGLSALGLGGLASAPAIAAAVLGGLSAPLLDGGAGQARVDAQRAALDQARAHVRSTVLTALQDVEDALVALQDGRTLLAQRQEAAEAAGRAAMLAEQRWRGGLIDFQTVLSTQRARLDAQDAQAGAALTLATAQIRLHKALGGGWDASSLEP